MKELVDSPVSDSELSRDFGISTARSGIVSIGRWPSLQRPELAAESVDEAMVQAGVGRSSWVEGQSRSQTPPFRRMSKCAHASRGWGTPVTWYLRNARSP